MPRAPDFWTETRLASTLLLPLGWAHSGLAKARRALTRPYRVPVPVICVGNLVAGGAGKTPVVLSLAKRLSGHAPHIVSRGYLGKLGGPLRVDPDRHTSAEVGDEALLLAKTAPSWIGHDRAATARLAVECGAGCLILDDGFQNPTLAKDLSLLIVDGSYGLGNGRVIPAGPLREGLSSGLARAGALVLMGEDKIGIAARIGGVPLLRASLRASNTALAGKKVVAFAGIGQPVKFFRTLEEIGAQLVGRHPFPDHHPYRDAELGELCAEATNAGAELVTTEKDAARLAARWRARVRTLPVEIRWQDEDALDALLMRVLGNRHG
jgi:tetraacyldisaccharide 4'-kinase